MLSRYLEQSLGTLLRQQQGVQTEMTKALESPLTPLAELTRQNMELWARMQASMLSAFAPPRASRPSEPEPPPMGDASSDEPPVPPSKP
jgi:polyhydroxyalkanoate synthesis regulator protein